MSPGRRRIACDIAVCTSWAAESMSRFSENVQRDARVAVGRLIDVISSTPEIRLNSRSSGIATVVAMIFGIGAGQRGGHRDRGEIDVRQIVDRQRREPEPAEEHDRRKQHRGRDGPLDENARNVHGFTSFFDVILRPESSCSACLALPCSCPCLALAALAALAAPSAPASTTCEPAASVGGASVHDFLTVVDSLGNDQEIRPIWRAIFDVLDLCACRP